MKKMNIIAAAALLASVASVPAFAQLQARGGSCTATLSGQAKAEYWSKTGGVLKDTNDGAHEALGFVDIQLDNQCDLTSSTKLEMRLRQRPLKGSNFDIQGHNLGSREAWVGLANNSYGKVRVGRFLAKMNSVLDWPYGAPNLNAQASDYGSTPSAPTRNGSLRYIAPTLYGADIEATIGGPNTGDFEVYGQYKLAGFAIDAIHSRAKMNAAYRNAAGGAYSFNDQRSLTNHATFLGARYEFGNQAKVLAGFKNNVFSYPVSNNAKFSASGSFKQETAFNELVISGEYPIAPKWTASAGIVRYLDSKTRGVSSNDGATLFGAVLSYAVTPATKLSLNFRQTTLDSVGAIPGSGSGVNNAIPSTTRGSLGLENREWVFDQGAGFGAKRVNYLGVAVEYQF
jgi:predicted porin